MVVGNDTNPDEVPSGVEENILDQLRSLGYIDPEWAR